MSEAEHYDYPEPILSDWRKHHAALRSAIQIMAQLPELSEQIDRLEREHTEALAPLKERYQQLGKQRTEHMQNADTCMEVVQGWCGRHGVPLPNEPADPEPTAPVRGVHDAGIWERATCLCGQPILRDQLTPGAPWGHPGNGGVQCHPDDPDRLDLVAQPSQPLSERLQMPDHLDAHTDTAEEAKTDG